MKQKSMASAARRQITCISGGGAPTIKNRAHSFSAGRRISSRTAEFGFYAVTSKFDVFSLKQLFTENDLKVVLLRRHQTNTLFTFIFIFYNKQ